KPTVLQIIHAIGRFFICSKTGFTCFLKATNKNNNGNMKKKRIEALQIQLPPASSMERLKIKAKGKNKAASKPIKIGRNSIHLLSKSNHNEVSLSLPIRKWNIGNINHSLDR